MIARLFVPLQTVGRPAAARCFTSLTGCGRLRTPAGKPWGMAAVCFMFRSR